MKAGGHARRELNQAAGDCARRAHDAADRLMVLLPNAPPKPALPRWPMSLRETKWLAALRDAAHAHADDADIQAGAVELRNASHAWAPHMRAWMTAPQARADWKALMAALEGFQAPGSILDLLTAAVAANRLTPAQAAAWRVRCGLPDAPGA